MLLSFSLSLFYSVYRALYWPFITAFSIPSRFWSFKCLSFAENAIVLYISWILQAVPNNLESRLVEYALLECLVEFYLTILRNCCSFLCRKLELNISLQSFASVPICMYLCDLGLLVT